MSSYTWSWRQQQAGRGEARCGRGGRAEGGDAAESAAPSRESCWSLPRTSA
eukprot:CAMPEP_0185361758 /NCGR_PEP_ID=MMETSP1364-20130426/10536_1 /TAXON_ID=38817 /ORGANISM="Gephyrocapsa oceanica, Strain RCC1303" /LENGTH=50 /DNA_ID=CAMNT_0027962103 /DNA_START=10 /DNA_END=158 /DNA_ORIENTATION=+